MDVKGKLIRRLLGAWMLLSVLLGTTVFILEQENIDKEVIRMVVRDSNVYSEADLQAMNQPGFLAESLQQKTQGLISNHFIVVELYDRRRMRLLEVVADGHRPIEDELKKRRHGFPRDNDPHYEKFLVQGQLIIQAVVPLKSERGDVLGFLEGVYRVDQTTWDAIVGRVVRSVVFAILASLATTLLIYPIILSLNRGLIKFSRDLIHGNIELMEVLGSAIAKRDSDTNAHNYRVTYYAIRLGERVGIGHLEMRDLIAGAFLHDVGKIGISDSILLKQGRLTEGEFAVMKTHVTLGVEILQKSAWLTRARDVVEFHHEKFDGSGYMRGLQGADIPLNARIFAIVDVFDALTSRRPYKEPMPFPDAIRILEEGRGKHFDPALLDHFSAIALALYEEAVQYADHEIEQRVSGIVAGYYFSASNSAA